MHLIKNGALRKFLKKKEEPKRVGLKCQQTAAMRKEEDVVEGNVDEPGQGWQGG